MFYEECLARIKANFSRRDFEQYVQPLIITVFEASSKKATEDAKMSSIDFSFSVKKRLQGKTLKIDDVDYIKFEDLTKVVNDLLQERYNVDRSLLK
jgi:hypothetical protein